LTVVFAEHAGKGGFSPLRAAWRSIRSLLRLAQAFANDFDSLEAALAAAGHAAD
jgi:hypothetical protein